MSDSQISITPTDLLAMMAFEAQKIVSSSHQVAAGAQFPNPVAIAQVVQRMAAINSQLLSLIEEPAPKEEEAA